MPSPEKEKEVAALAERLSTSRTIFLTDHTGMDVETISRLRGELRKVGAEYRVVKNTLTRLACAGSNLEELAELISGPSALVLVDGDDPVGSAKVLTGFVKENEKPVLKAGYDGVARDGKWIELLAKVPKKEVLAGQLIGLLSLPLRRLVTALSAPPRNLVLVLDQVARRDSDGPEPG